MKPRLLIWTDESEPYLEAMRQAGLDARVEVSTCRRGQLPEAHVLEETRALAGWPPPPGALARMPRLEWIQAFAVGVNEWLDRPDMRGDIAISCARGVHRVQMPENILGALFHVTKHYAVHAANSAAGRWVRRVSEPLAGKTLGILGLGTIGRELARKAAALEMRVIGTKRSPEPMDEAEVFAPEDADEVLRQSDFVVLLLPQTKETENFMNAARLRLMKPSAWLLNFSRGHLVVDADLVEAVRSKTIAGAVLDTFRVEPLPADHPFWKTEGILVLPHIGGGHPDRDRIVAGLVVENLGRWLDGETPLHLVDRTRGY